MSIDYDEFFARSQKTLVRDVADLYNEGITRNEIAVKLDIGETTASHYLRRATDLGWCCYDPHKEMRESAIQDLSGRKIRCAVMRQVRHLKRLQKLRIGATYRLLLSLCF